MTSPGSRNTQRIDLKSAYVLHLRPYRETSAIVDLLNADGRISCVVKGVRGNRKSAQLQRATLQPFQRLLCGWTGRSELKTLSKFESDGRALSLQGDVLFSGLYVNELLTKIYHGSAESDAIFYLYENTIKAMSVLSSSHLTEFGVLNKYNIESADGKDSVKALEEELEIELRAFELKLLEKIGYGIDFFSDAQTGKSIEANDRVYRYVVERGFEMADDDVSGQSNKPLLLKGCQICQLREAIVTRSWPDKSLLRDAKKLSRMALSPLLAGKTIETRKLFQR